MILREETLERYGWTYEQARPQWPVVVKCDKCGEVFTRQKRIARTIQKGVPCRNFCDDCDKTIFTGKWI